MSFYPCFNAIRTKPLRVLSTRFIWLGEVSSTSKAPPMTIAATFPVPLRLNVKLFELISLA